MGNDYTLIGRDKVSSAEISKEQNRVIAQCHEGKMHVSGKYKESFRLSKNLKTSLVYPRKDSNVVSVEDHVHL